MPHSTSCKIRSRRGAGLLGWRLNGKCGDTRDVKGYNCGKVLNMRVLLGLLITVICLQSQQTPQAASAQPDPTLPQQPIFKGGTQEVIVPVTVTDDKGRFVSNLDQKDFQIFDQSKEQVIKSFSRERNQPVVVGFLIDLSNGSRTQWKHWVDSAEAMVEEMLNDTRSPEQKKRFGGYLIGYGNEAELMVDTTSE